MSGLALAAISAGIQQGNEDIRQRGRQDIADTRVAETHDINMRKGEAGIRRSDQQYDIAGAQETDRVSKFKTDAAAASKTAEQIAIERKEKNANRGYRDKRKRTQETLDAYRLQDAGTNSAARARMEKYAADMSRITNPGDLAKAKAVARTDMQNIELEQKKHLYSYFKAVGGKKAAIEFNNIRSNGITNAADIKTEKVDGKTVYRLVDGAGETINDPKTGEPVIWDAAEMEMQLGRGGADSTIRFNKGKGEQWNKTLGRWVKAIDSNGRQIMRDDSESVMLNGTRYKPGDAVKAYNAYVKAATFDGSADSVLGYAQWIKSQQKQQDPQSDYSANGPKPEPTQGGRMVPIRNKATGQLGWGEQTADGKVVNAKWNDGGAPSTVQAPKHAKPVAAPAKPAATPLESAINKAKDSGIAYGEARASKQDAAGRRRVAEGEARQADHDKKVARLESSEAKASKEWNKLNSSLTTRGKTRAERAEIKRKMAAMLKAIMEIQGHIKDLE